MVYSKAAHLGLLKYIKSTLGDISPKTILWLHMGTLEDNPINNKILDTHFRTKSQLPGNTMLDMDSAG